MTATEARPLQDLAALARAELLERVSQAVRHARDVEIAVAFGSFVRDERFRDIDVAILFAEPFRWRALGPAEAAVQAALGPLAPLLDLIPLNDAPPSFRCAVLAAGRVLYERVPGAAAELLVRSRSQQIDYREWRRAHGVPL